MKKEFGVEVELVEFIPGSGGIFTVCVDDKPVYSKHETGRFPEDGEIVGLLR